VATGHAYDVLKLDGTDDTVIVPVVRNKAVVPGVSASEILFSKVAKSNECDGAVRIIGNIRDFQMGGDIQVGPTPVNKLYLRGTMAGRDDVMSRILLKVVEIISNAQESRSRRLSPKAWST
jgi:predicted transcriptional regulator